MHIIEALLLHLDLSFVHILVNELHVLRFCNARRSLRSIFILEGRGLVLTHISIDVLTTLLLAVFHLLLNLLVLISFLILCYYLEVGIIYRLPFGLCTSFLPLYVSINLSLHLCIVKLL